MKNRSKTIPTRILFSLIGAFFLFAGVNAIVNGRFREGGRYGLSGPEFVRADEPLQFWICVVGVLIIGMIAVWTALPRK
jgi:hypothetical protein